MRSSVVLALAVFAWAPEVPAETFETRDDFSVTLPSGWVEAPPGALRHLEAAIAELSQGANEQHYDYGYQLESASTWFEYPYILVQVRRDGRVPEGQLTQYEKIESELREGAERVEETFRSVFSNLEQGEIAYDEAEHVLWSAATMNVQGVGAVRSLVAVKLTEFGFIQLMGYAREETFAQYSPIFREAVHSLAVAEEHAYRPRLTDHAPSFFGINLGQTLIAGLVGGLAGGAAALIARWKRRRDRRPA